MPAKKPNEPAAAEPMSRQVAQARVATNITVRDVPLCTAKDGKIEAETQAAAESFLRCDDE